MAASKKPRTSTGKARPAKSKSDAPPWESDNPKGDHHQHLSPSAKAAAKRRAKKAGRPYPNLVDNMHAAREAKK